ncbi:hypothetical protein K439DRAFT_1625413 [Ramaria rubella]|nr:hypothetical protein K439DRAFT_1625413 [Ramaria rubella]
MFVGTSWHPPVLSAVATDAQTRGHVPRVVAGVCHHRPTVVVSAVISMPRGSTPPGEYGNRRRRLQPPFQRRRSRESSLDIVRFSVTTPSPSRQRADQVVTTCRVTPNDFEYQVVVLQLVLAALYSFIVTVSTTALCDCIRI